MSNCNMCGEIYRGLAADCACTAYGAPRRHWLWWVPQRFRKYCLNKALQGWKKADEKRDKVSDRVQPVVSETIRKIP